MRRFLLLFLLLLSTLVAEEKITSTPTIKVAFGFDRPPFIFGRTTSKGIETDIVQEAMALEGYDIEIVQMSKYYLESILHQSNDIDAVAAISRNPNDGLFYSDDFIAYENYAISRTKDHLEINSLEDLTTVQFVAWQDAYRDLGEKFYTLFNPLNGTAKSHYRDTSSQIDDCKLFFSKKVDVILSDKTIFGWHKKVLHNHDQYSYHPIFSKPTNYPVVFRDAKLRDIFNQGLQKLKASGRYDEIINFYYKEDIQPLLKFSDLLADISGKFLFSIDKVNLDKILRYFFLHPDIMGIEVFNTNASEPFLALSKKGGRIQEGAISVLKDYSKISKKSYYLNQGNPLLVGKIVIYYKKNLQLGKETLTPPFGVFSFFSEGVYRKIKASYEKFGLLRDDIPTEVNTIERSSLLGLLSYQEIFFYVLLVMTLFIVSYKRFLNGRLSHVSLKSFHIFIICFEIGMITFLIYEISVLDRTENALAKAHEEQYKMIQVLDLARQSSNDLSQFARAYSVTHDAIYKEKYFTIMRIREGKEARPEGYGAVYWDLDEATREMRHRKGTHKESLHEIIESLPFSPIELKKIDEAGALYCNGLHHLEKQVFEENSSQASKLFLYSKAYDVAKHQAMLPIDELISMVTYRTKHTIEQLHQEIANQFKYLLILGLLFIVGNLFIALLLRKKVIIPVEYLTHVIRKFQKDQKHIRKRHFYEDEIGVMIDEFFKMHQKIEESKEKQLKLLKELEAQKRVVEQRVKEEVEKNKEQQLMVLYQNRLAQMGEVLNMVAHQWRQPLNNILLTNEVLVFKYEMNMVTDETIQEFQEESNMIIKEMSQTIDDFRDFFKPKKTSEIFSLNETINGVFDLSKQMLRQHGIVFRIVAEKNFLVSGHANELGQAILNIINNAKDALIDKEGEKSIEITLLQQERKVELLISDNAGGIPSDIINRIFEPYFSTKENKNGTGLGLYMSKMIIEEHMKGELSVSNGTQGAIFRILLEVITPK